MDDLLADFLTETSESLAELDVALVKLERAPDDSETLSLIFRLVHTIKGTCGFLGLPRLERVAHAAENVLGRVRDKVLPVTPDLVSTVLAALDRIKDIVAGLAATETEPAGDDATLIAALDAVAEGRAAGAAAAGIVAQPPEAAPEPAAEAAVAGQTIRVGVDVLEDLMTLVSELVLTRNQLLQLARSQENASFAVPLQRLSHITSDLQEGVMKTRMQPIGNAWNKLPRLVRDLARDLDKRIELVMLGAETELDRQVLELIKDPLTHMVRNSGDHGLEAPAERHAAGKPETGHISLNAFHEGGHIIIEIADDGRGLPVDRIRAKVVAKGLATEAELAGMSDMQIQRFIFRPGFSTAAAVTAVSGRGVGMDVVKTNIERIGGTIDLKSVPGHGTTFTIKIPLTLAIVSALIVEAGGERFAIPQISVVELVRAGGARQGQGDGAEPMIERIDGTPVLRLRDRLLPLVNLNDLLQLGGGTESAQDGSVHIVVAQVGASTLGIIVDRVFDTEEIVVKPVAPILRHITMFSGNTILGDGSVIMILDPNGIARATGIAGGSEARTAEAREAGRDAAGMATASHTAMLLFRAGGAEPRAVPLGLVARLEDIPQERIEFSAGQPVTQYRGRLMPLVPMAGALDMDKSRQSVLVFTDVDRALGRDRCMGLVVDEIVDVVEDQLRIELTGDRAGLLGTAVIAGNATDVIDIGYWLTQAFRDWFRGNERGGPLQGARLLVVEDSDFFRQLLVPALSAAGYDVTAVGDAAQALRLRDAGVMFDAVVSDIEMPDMGGLAFVADLRAGGGWAQLPVVALTGHAGAARIAAGREAGFTDYVQKFERDALLASLRQCLAARSDARLAA
ncbi:hybrid sensor histidine kinase/response regulator [Limobrevibacterium gyesilva]|uniref:Chemotaxis protein CheA n=1 Tax=Limobrevibacterium gyesilva TaxID=2991712 RepID=A0AA42CCA2_9PROT|nr:chemotaxis protein CheW [Limobrevibacterium gyesilva]MCW3472968.1 chemotaxis protein CheW [Limobrevibacterium gyesilva]